jgi:Na+-transporting methylmalonyl-CoA/oxaloacetate decarboxylase beta subunit
MTLTRKNFIVSLAGLLVAWFGLTLVWLGVVDKMSPITLVLVLGGMIGIFFPALQQTYQDDLARFSPETVRRAWYAGVAMGAATIVVFIALGEATTGDPKLHALLSLPVAAIAGVIVLMVTEKGVLRISRGKNGSQ